MSDKQEKYLLIFLWTLAMAWIVIAAYLDNSYIGIIIGIIGALVFDIILFYQEETDAPVDKKPIKKILYN